ncbi:MAG: hypothetical protein IJ456_01610 [Bacteroides sp.]|nr:hypothetical protein [Bacteroides sp.]
MKKNYLLFASLLLCTLVVFSFSFVGCSDDTDEFNYPEGAILPQGDEAQPFKVTRLKGTLEFDDIVQKYVIYPKNVSYPFESTANNGYNKIFISNMPDEYKLMRGNIEFSGMVQKLYSIAYSHICLTEGYFSIELSELLSDIDSRSLPNDSHDFYCPTPIPTPPTWFFTRSFTELNYNTSYNFRVFIHVVRPTSGIVNGYIKENVASATIENLNDYYEEANITFSLLGSDYIDDDKYINMTWEQCNNVNNFGNGLFTENTHLNAIDIYILTSAPNIYNNIVKLYGLANGIPGNACLVTELNYLNATIAHEIGHCLGLYHTHHGTSYREQNEETCAELVDGSNSLTCGDYITDTPADPFSWNLCTYSGTVTDANGDSYNPDPENIMSYSKCQSKHTQKQIERIYETIDHSTMLQALCEKTVADKTTTPLAIGNEASYTLSVDAPDNYIVTWDVTCKSCTSKTASTTYSETLIGRSVNLTNRYPNASSQRYDIEITIRTHLHDYEFKIYKTLLKISNLATTGTMTWGTETNCGIINLSNPQNSSPIIVRKGEYLSFIYTDACGASSYTDNNLFSYNIYSPSGFTPITGANHMFKCESYATTTTTSGRMMLSFTYPGSSTIMQLPIQILAGTNTLNTDSLELEELYMKDEALINER